ncbi:MAG: DUF11 domain-containing protein [Gammaproteobacteria bacterium]|nr:DUF11 domain-containing protein [Gammaproteobacteria bacterium]
MKTLSKQKILFILAAFFLVFVILLAATHTLAAGPWYVGPDGSDGNDCLSPETACATIHVAIGRASSGETVIVLPGMYSAETGTIFPLNLPPGIELRGSGRDTTVIHGESDEPVLYIGSSSTDILGDTVVTDLTLQNGQFGLELYSSEKHTTAPFIANLRVSSNTTGIKMSTSGTYEEGATIAAVISNTEIISNTNNGIRLAGYGYFSKGKVKPLIVDSLIQGNGNHGIYMLGTATGSNGSYAAPSVIRTHIIGNGNHGIYASGTYQGWVMAVIDQSVIAENEGYGFYWEQGINRGNIDTDILNTVIANNQSGGVYINRRSEYVSTGRLDILNSNIVDNLNWGIYWVHGPHDLYRDVNLNVVNTILWNPLADDLYSTDTPWMNNDIQYSDIEDGDWNGVSGNFSADPLFFDSYHLSACSPAINAGTTVDTPDHDIDGDPRPLGSTSDVGVDEYQALCLLSVNKQVSSDHVLVGETLIYTISVTNTAVITSANLTLTDTLPSSLALDPASIWSSAGLPAATGNSLIWAGTLFPGEALTIGFQAVSVAGDVFAENYALVKTDDGGQYRSPMVSTFIEKIIIFLPAIFAPPSPGLMGHVTLAGAPISGVQLDLRYNDGSSWSTLATTTTDSQGYYSFTNVPSLGAGDSYYVRYLNSNNTSGRLAFWGTQTLETYTTGTEVEIGDFDIANIGLVSPPNRATISLPYTFQWTPRAANPTDSYELLFYDPVDFNPVASTGFLGYIDNLTITGLPSGFNAGVQYAWEVWVRSPDGGQGVSRVTRTITFSNSAGPVSTSTIWIDHPPIFDDMPIK